MSKRSVASALLGAALFTGSALAVGAVAPAAADTSSSGSVEARPLLRVPFDCGRTWRTATGDHHNNDGWHSVDMNWGSGDDDLGSPVLASAAGTAWVHRHIGGYGNHVIVRHGGGWSTLYAHLSQVHVGDGQSVGPTTVLGLLGESGNVSGPHLHYAQRENDVVKPIVFGESTAISYPTGSAARIRDCR